MNKIEQIFGRNISEHAKPLFIFEMANNHMGDVEHGLKIIREMDQARQGFDFNFAIKFQYRDLDTFIHPDYKDRMDLKYIKRFSEARLTPEQFLTLKGEAEKLGFITICTPFDEKSVEKIAEHNYDIIKIGSCSFTDWPLLEKIVQYDKPIIASTGSASLEDIDKVVSFLQHRGKTFALMHCVGEYPTIDSQLQLNQIRLLQDRYHNVPIGFSTHEEPNNYEAVKIGIGQGASIFEKHVAVKTDKYAPNAYSALPEDVKKWLQSARKAFEICGVKDGRHAFSAKELADIRQFQRGVFAKKDIKKGEKVDVNNTFFAFPNQPDQVLANNMSKYNVFIAQEDIKEKAPVINVSRQDTREKVYEIVIKTRDLLADAKVPVSNKLDFEISHHYGIDRFYEYGAVLVTCFNREYCKKLIILHPGQKHPSHWHNVKEETFHIIYGDFVFDLDGSKTECKAGDIITINRGVKHDFMSKSGGIFEEISTTHQASDSFYVDESIAQNKYRKTQLTYWVD